MHYQIITHDDNYYIIEDNELNFAHIMSHAKWFREAPYLVLSAVESDYMTKEDIQGNSFNIQYNFNPAESSDWEYKELAQPKLEQTQVMQDISGDFQLTAYYVSNHTYLVEVMNINTKEILAKTFPALWEPRFGVDHEDMNNILMTAEELCTRHESGDYQDLLKAE